MLLVAKCSLPSDSSFPRVRACVLLDLSFFVKICCRREDLQRDIMIRMMAIMIGEDDGGAYLM